jgi:uncharacterized protein YecT (DUF1311 family)
MGREKSVQPELAAKNGWGEEGARPSSLVPFYKCKVDPSYLLQLKRKVEIANEETVRNDGPLPPGGLPVRKKTKPYVPHRDFRGNLVPRAPMIKEEDEMKFSRIAMPALLGAALTVGVRASPCTPGEPELAKEIMVSTTENTNTSAITATKQESTNQPSHQSAKEAGYRKSFDQCMDASNGVTVDMMNCGSEEFDYQDKRLNAAYKHLRQVLLPTDWEAVRNGQRKWLADMDKACQGDEEVKGGTLEMIEFMACKLDRTVRRADELEALLEQHGY